MLPDLNPLQERYNIILVIWHRKREKIAYIRQGNIALLDVPTGFQKCTCLHLHSHNMELIVTNSATPMVISNRQYVWFQRKLT